MGDRAPDNDAAFACALGRVKRFVGGGKCLSSRIGCVAEVFYGSQARTDVDLSPPLLVALLRS
jgi:hypothetical protein